MTRYKFPISGEGQTAANEKSVIKDTADQTLVQMSNLEVTIPKGWTLESSAGDGKEVLWVFSARASAEGPTRQFTIARILTADFYEKSKSKFSEAWVRKLSGGGERIEGTLREDSPLIEGVILNIVPPTPRQSEHFYQVARTKVGVLEIVGTFPVGDEAARKEAKEIMNSLKWL